MEVGLKAVSPDPSKLPAIIWLSATEGDLGNELGKLEHWPDGVEAEEGVWRDYYNGEQLGNYTKPWLNLEKDKVVGDNHNCVHFFPKKVETRTWDEWECKGTIPPRGCPCTYDSDPLIRPRGFCPNTLVEHDRYDAVSDLMHN